MNDEKLNNEMDDFFKAELEHLPEEKPSAADWEQMNKRIYAEGLLKSNGNGRRFLFLFLLLAMLSGLVSLPFLINDKTASNKDVSRNNINNETAKSRVTTGENNSSKQNASSTGAAEMATNSAAASGGGEPGYRLSGKGTMRNAGIDKGVSQEGKEQHDGNAAPQQEAAASAAAASANNNNPEIKSGEGTGPEDASAAAATATQAGAQEKSLPAEGPSDTANTTPQNVLAQQNDSTDLNKDDKTAAEAPRFKRFRLGLYASLDYNYYTLKENSNVADAEAEVVQQSGDIKGENFAGQYTIGIMGGYLFSQKLSLEAGAFYSQKKKLQAYISTPAYMSNSDEEMFSDFIYEYNAKYFELYGRVKYYFIRERNPFYATLGAAAGYNLPAGNDSSDYFARTSYGESGTVADHVALNSSSVGLTLVVSAGMEIPICKNWDMFIEPAYRYSVTPMVKHPSYDRIPVEHFLRGISLATGLMYKF
jgi:hypothetical protein